MSTISFEYFRLPVMIFLIILTGCSGKNGKSNPGLLPPASGQSAEIILSMDSLQWRGALGDSIRQIFSAEIQGLPREENLFTLRYVDPRKMTGFLREVSNLMFITTFDQKTRGARIIQNYFTKETREKIKENPNYFLVTSKDVYAIGQEVMYLFGQSEESLMKNLHEHRQRLVDHLNTLERERLSKKIFKQREKSISKAINERFNFNILFPHGYKLALMNNNFIWVRYMDEEIDKNIIISFTNYVDRNQFNTDSIIGFRDDICKKYIYEDKENMPESYLKTQTEVPFIPVISKQINFNGMYAIETRGLWKTNNESMGGPFIGITVVDESINRLYYIEGFLYSPGKPQRELVRELETILHTFTLDSVTVSK
ncbi:MAG: DUF4837 family protein [Cyclobacteriaceae bacterium]|nr:DUF4837 family protein [Cyclobacteriaceae bacterium]